MKWKGNMSSEEGMMIKVRVDQEKSWGSEKAEASGVAYGGGEEDAKVKRGIRALGIVL